MFYFFIAAVALLLSGVLLNEKTNVYSILALTACVLCGVVLIYRINDIIDQNKQLAFKSVSFFNNKTHLILGVLILILAPIVILTISHFCFLMLAISGIIGLLYSLTIKVNKKKYRLKNVFLLKNISIGISWGALILIGANNFNNPLVITLFMFTSIQVFIGSIIRDLPDKNKDLKNKVKSFPVVFGEKKTIAFMHLINICSFIIIWTCKWDINMLILVVLVIIWRLINLIGIKQNIYNSFWSQKVNLMTCFFIFFILLIEHIYGINN